MKPGTLSLTYFTYPNLTLRAGGFLPNEKGAFACWYFYTIAQKAKERIGEHTEDQFGLLEEHRWMDKKYVPQAWAVCTMYGLNNPDDFLKYAEAVERQAQLMGLPVPAPEYMRPLKLILPN